MVRFQVHAQQHIFTKSQSYGIVKKKKGGIILYLTDKSIRKNTAHRHAKTLKKTLGETFNGLLKLGHIQAFCEEVGLFKKEHFVFHIRYECTIEYKGVVKKVSFLFDFDIRSSSENIQEELFHKSNSSTFALSSSFNQKELFIALRKRVLQWKYGIQNEADFLQFLTELQTSCLRIDRVYKTSNYDDKKRGVDFVVIMFNKQYYESIEVKFNLKSSSYYLQKHKACHPHVGTFIFAHNVDLANEQNKKRLMWRFMRFLLLSASTKESVHM